jgi:hypothetical protein
VEIPERAALPSSRPPRLAIGSISALLALAAAQSVTSLTAMVYVRWPRSVDCGLQLGSPRGIGLGTTTNLVSTNTHIGKNIFERHALIKQH